MLACLYLLHHPLPSWHRKKPPTQEILAEAQSLADQGVKEITLLGQIVDRYGKDNPDYPTLGGLIDDCIPSKVLNEFDFLTSHPNYMTDELLDTVAEFPKVMPHIEVPIQAGNDQVLENMRRGYTNSQYRELVQRIRERIPGVSIATDIIVGFPGETEQQYQDTYDLLSDLKLDVAHLARYSPRTERCLPGAWKTMYPTKKNGVVSVNLEDLQESIATEIHAVI